MLQQPPPIVEATSSQPLHQQPRRRDLVLHGLKTIRLVKAVLWDKRVGLLRKGTFLGGIALLLLLLLVPEVLGASVTLLSPLFALVGVELPVEGAISWMALAFASFSLLAVFPKEILGEHYERIFRR